MPRFFIDRPIFAWVIALLIMLAGGIAIFGLPVAQYPEVALPQITIRATYPGASAETMDNSVTQPIEQNMTGIDNMLYMTSESTASGEAIIDITFEAGTDSDIAQVQVQNKLQLAVPTLPEEVQQQGLKVTKESATFLMVCAFYSEDSSMSPGDISDYIASNVQETLARLSGVGQVNLFGSSRAMRVWVDPDRLNNYSLTVGDIKTAILEQNVQVSGGQLGGQPAVENQMINATINVQDRLQTVEEFENILIRVNQDGSTLRLGDVAVMELGSAEYNTYARLEGRPAAGIGINLAAGANALETSRLVKAKIEELSHYFPQGLKWEYPYDTTPFVQLSINAVVETLIAAIVLVFLVMYLFMQNIRATLIPTISVPIVILGAFATFAAVGFTINSLTMFGLVLAIGMLVDDAIIIVENVERVMAEENCSPREATQKSMDQLTGAVVGTSAVIIAVFIPMAFFPGATGAIYRQFSLTIVATMTISLFMALTLTPALCATMLKPRRHGQEMRRTGFFGWFNRLFLRFSQAFGRQIEKVALIRFGAVGVYMVVTVLIFFGFRLIPTGFLPDEDQGSLYLQIQLPPGATRARTEEVVAEVERYFLEEEAASVRTLLTVVGNSFGGNGQNMGRGFITLKDWDERDLKRDSARAVAARAMNNLRRIHDAQIYTMVPPAITALGDSSGFTLQLQDRAGLGRKALTEARNQFLDLARSSGFSETLRAVRPNGMEDTPQLKLEVDKPKAAALGVSLADINDTMQTGWGGFYVNDFLDKGRVKEVYVQAVASARMLSEDLSKWFVRSSSGEMVPFTSFARTYWQEGSPRLERYNGLPAMNIVGEPAPGKSTGEAMAAVEAIAAMLPAGVGAEWTGISLQEQQAGSQTLALYTISIIVIFLCLAALYESWSTPIAIMIAAPVGILGVEIGAFIFSQANDVYFQVGFLTVVALVAKNAILVVEFAEQLQAEGGLSLYEATLTASKLRLRPIVMTSLTTILGTLPLAVSSGAGSGSQNAIGIAITAGMLTITFMGIYFIPLCYINVRRFFDFARGKRSGSRAAA